MMPNNETTPKQNSAAPKLNHHPAQSFNQQPRFFADQSAQSPLHQQPRLFAEVVKSSRNHFDSVDHETMLKLLNIYEMIRQS